MKAVCKGSDLASWENSLSKKMAINPLNITKQGHKLSSNDRQLLHKYLAALTPAYEQVPALMTIFSEELSAKLKSCSDLIELMAWCHQKIVEIHPYEDGNGRVARLAMNILAIQGGRSPILFDNEANYLRAVDNASIEKFTTYLRSLVALQNELEPFTQDCFQFFFEELRRLYNF
jgi:prophage maintenance system killer protein